MKLRSFIGSFKNPEFNYPLLGSLGLAFNLFSGFHDSIYRVISSGLSFVGNFIISRGAAKESSSKTQKVANFLVEKKLEIGHSFRAGASGALMVSGAESGRHGEVFSGGIWLAANLLVIKFGKRGLKPAGLVQIAAGVGLVESGFKAKDAMQVSAGISFVLAGCEMLRAGSRPKTFVEKVQKNTTNGVVLQ